MWADCIEWDQSRDKDGYGFVTVAHRKHRTHRLAWEIMVGPLTAGVQVLHRCDNPSCFNVTHLILGSQKDNARDMAAKSRGATAKVTASEVNEIRIAWNMGVGMRALGAVFGVTKQSISDIINGRSYVA